MLTSLMRGRIRSQLSIISPYFPSFSTESHDDFQPQVKKVPEGMEEIITLIDKQVKDNKILLYMKGTPAAPQCGFSMKVFLVI